MKTFFAFAALLVVTGCGAFPDPAACAAGCAGCCDPTGVCHAGNSDTACGLSGQACGTCSVTQACNAGVCGAPICAPQTCSVGACGDLPDGCGGVVHCGGCAQGESCGGGGQNLCGFASCSPKVCAQLPNSCGVVSDGCATTLSCGGCSNGNTCGGGGVPGVCGQGCNPTTCLARGKNCGVMSNGCGVNLACGTCTGLDVCGGGGSANVCGQGCNPASCTSLGKNCGSVSDGCGATLSCGSCAAPLSCGGAGTANICGATCRVSCPSGYSCDLFGVCAGGSPAAVVLDVKTVNVSGSVTLNGALPTTLACSGTKAEVIFTETTQGYSFTFPIPCGFPAFDWSGTVYPGTYSVKVAGYAGRTNLPNTYFFTNTALPVNANAAGLVLDVKTVNVSGSVTLNGALPTTLACSGTKAEVIFTETTQGYSFTFPIPCGFTPFDWSGTLYAGTYSVKVAGYAGRTNLPNTYFVTNAALPVNANTAGLALDVKTVNVSGSVTLNGALPTTLACSGTKAEVIFTETTQGYSFTFPIPCGFTPFDWAGTLYAGTYSVKVAGYAGRTNLPNTYFFTNTALPVTANTAGLVLDVKTVNVAGSVTLNGALPTTLACSGTKAEVIFTETTQGYSFTFPIPCGFTPFDWSGTLYAGTYSVKVAGYAGRTNLPNTYFFTNAALPVSANTAGLVLDVKTVNVSGSVTLNGALPTTLACSGTKAEVIFTETTRGYSFTYPIPCGFPAFDWSGTLYAGTYSVKVAGYAGRTNLPNTYYFAVDQLRVP